MNYDGKYKTSENLNADQIYFVNQIVEFVVRNILLRDFSVLQKEPFTDRGSIDDVFTYFSVWAGIKSVIDEINVNVLY